MKIYLPLALAIAALVAISSAANIKKGPWEERVDGREEEGEDTLALAGDKLGEMINDANHYVR